MKKSTLALLGLTITSQIFTDYDDDRRDRRESRHDRREDRRENRYDRWQDRRQARRERIEDEGVVGGTVDGAVGVADDAVQGTLTGLFGSGDRRRRREERYRNDGERNHRYDYRNDKDRRDRNRDEDSGRRYRRDRSNRDE